MASVSTDKNGSRMVQFIAGDGKRRTIRLGKADMKTARDVARRVEALNVAKIAGQVIGRDHAEWLAVISDKLHEKLAAVGLVSDRAARPDAPTLADFLADFIAKRTPTAAPNTVASLGVAANRLKVYFGDELRVDAITPGRADEWLLWLKGKYADATVGRSVKRARQFFRAAVRSGILTENPFLDLKAPAQTNEARKFFVTLDTTRRVLDACPDAEWRLIFALSRFGGLRCPSEHLAVTWPDVDWARNRFLIKSPKTGDRWVPIFAELHPFLEAVFEAAPDGTLHVIRRRRDSASRWGVLLHRILAAAGVAPWERIFHNLRASRQTELTALYSIGTVCRWFGNSAMIANTHYLTALETDFERAAAAGALQNPVQQTATNGVEPLHTSTPSIAETLEIARYERKHPEACKSQGG